MHTKIKNGIADAKWKFDTSLLSIKDHNFIYSTIIDNKIKLNCY